jgi:hypothetical protein
MPKNTKRLLRISILSLIILLIIVIIISLFNKQTLIKTPINYLIKYRVNHYLLKNSPWKISKLEISNFSSDKIFTKDKDKDKTKKSPKYIKKTNLKAPIITLEKSRNLKSQNKSPKQITLTNLNFESNLKYPLKDFQQKFNLNSEALYIDSDKLRESPILALARNVITDKGVRIKDIKITGVCNTKAHICKFDHIKLGKNNLIISGTGFYEYKKAFGNFNLIMRFPKLKKLKLHLNIKIKDHHVITKMEKLSIHKLFSMV